MEIGWEYNDENYYRSEDGGGVPKIAYQSKQDAVIACAEMNAKRLEQPQWQELVIEWGDEPEYVTEFFEVKEVEYIGE
jgi:hypothetical protein